MFRLLHCNCIHICSYGGERYEKKELQIRVRQRFAELQSIDEEQGRVPWHVVDASLSIDEVKAQIAKIATDTIERVQSESAPLCRMWGEGEYELPASKPEGQILRSSRQLNWAFESIAGGVQSETVLHLTKFVTTYSHSS